MHDPEISAWRGLSVAVEVLSSLALGLLGFNVIPFLNVVYSHALPVHHCPHFVGRSYSILLCLGFPQCVKWW